MTSDLTIVGAGLAGLLAAHSFSNAVLHEATPAPEQAHRAVLRFRSDAVARLTGIEFTPVTVRKGIWIEGEFVPPSIQTANFYAKKCLGALVADRSIWNIEPAQRWVAPESFYEQMVESVGSRIQWATAHDFANPGPTISTAPLPATLEALGIQTVLEFRRAPIHVERHRVKGAAVYQTIYFPDPATPVYRASITGDLLIVEAMDEIAFDDFDEVLQAFGLNGETVEQLDSGQQRFGKIVPLAQDVRRALLHRLTAEHAVFSVGRFATWRNILLDDVVQDLAVVRKLLRASKYERALFAL